MIDKIKNFLGDRYQRNEYPALAYQYELWRTDTPLKGVKVLDGTPVFANTLLKYINLIAGGAVLTVGYCDNIPYDPNVIAFLQSIGVNCVKDPSAENYFDVILDCNASYRELAPRYGFAELTRSGSYHFENTKSPVINVDDSRIKAIETCLGTGEGFLRAMNHLNLQISGKKIAIMGCGKVGRGIAFYAVKNGGKVWAVDDVNVVGSLPGVEVVSRFDRAKVLDLLKEVDIVVSATGIASALSDEEYLSILRNGKQIIANMGVEDEWGRTLPEERVLNHKQPLNFILPEPTSLCYIDPTMAIHNQAAVELINKVYTAGLNRLDGNVHDLYWQVVEENGIFADELKESGL